MEVRRRNNNISKLGYFGSFQVTDDLEQDLSLYFTNIAEGEISWASSKKIRAMLKMIDEIESTGDAIFAMSKVVSRIKEKKIKLNQHQNESMEERIDSFSRDLPR